MKKYVILCLQDGTSIFTCVTNIFYSLCKCFQAVNNISELLLAKIRELGSMGTTESVQLLEKQLEKSFKLYRVPTIRPFVLETLKQLPKAPDR